MGGGLRGGIRSFAVVVTLYLGCTLHRDNCM